jgi:hypothetical protein
MADCYPDIQNTGAMKKGICFLLFGTFIMMQAEGHVELTFPEGGEIFHPGDAVNVTWVEVVRHDPLNWDLFFSKDGGGTWDTLKLDIPTETLSYRWNVPVIQTEKGRIKIVQDNVDANYEWISNNFTISSATGIPDPSHTLQMKIYPNPLIDYAEVEIDNFMNGDFSLYLYNMHGGLVRSVPHITSGTIRIDRGNLTAGLYLILLKEEEEIRAVGTLTIK